MEIVTDFIFLGSKITVDGDCSHRIKRPLLLERKAMTNLDSILKKRHYFAKKCPSSQSYGFSSSHVWLWELNHKESWVLKNWCFWTVVLEKTLESPLDSKEIKPVNPKRNQSWIFIGRNDADTVILWLPDVKCRFIGKDSDAGKIEGRRRGQRKIRWLDSITDSMDMIWSELQEIRTRKPGMLQFMGSQKNQTWLRDWATITISKSDILGLPEHT